MKFKLLILLLTLAVGFTSCSTKEMAESEPESATSSNDPDEWPDMDSFHMIMAEAFHPYKDSTNLGPVKVLAEEMAQEADKWAAASLPDKVNSEAVQAQLNQLKQDSRSLADKIKGGASDEEIGNSLKGLHDVFHGIMEAWNGASGEEHQH
ncbi:MAG: hypothetical protein HC819_24550 [Cyclobacteriaceae bacterium]|nr:hypothetical protein [Cyclobacteriaceae bacterium]